MEYSCEESDHDSYCIEDCLSKILKKYKKMPLYLNSQFDKIIMKDKDNIFIRGISLREIQSAYNNLSILGLERSQKNPRVFFNMFADNTGTKGLYLAFKYNHIYGTWYIYDSHIHGIYIINIYMSAAIPIESYII